MWGLFSRASGSEMIVQRDILPQLRSSQAGRRPRTALASKSGSDPDRSLHASASALTGATPKEGSPSYFKNSLIPSVTNTQTLLLQNV